VVWLRSLGTLDKLYLSSSWLAGLAPRPLGCPWSPRHVLALLNGMTPRSGPHADLPNVPFGGLPPEPNQSTNPCAQPSAGCEKRSDELVT